MSLRVHQILVPRGKWPHHLPLIYMVCDGCHQCGPKIEGRFLPRNRLDESAVILADHVAGFYRYYEPTKKFKKHHVVLELCRGCALKRFQSLCQDQVQTEELASLRRYLGIHGPLTNGAYLVPLEGGRSHLEEQPSWTLGKDVDGSTSGSDGGAQEANSIGSICS